MFLVTKFYLKQYKSEPSFQPMLKINQKARPETTWQPTLIVPERNPDPFRPIQRQLKDEILLPWKSIFLRTFIRIFRVINFLLNYNDFLRTDYFATETEKRPIGSPKATKVQAIHGHCLVTISISC